ncbi:hypothetical protein R3P38DRAFT_2948331 [Favolaschia claudopus]|uniref:Uncharacterized protein n=1 Tax=Favolaschia claudopus TaxID=2862362 RepID=A0AAW0BJZ6_9AGAR
MPSDRQYELRRGVTVYATGFVFTHNQLEQIARGACDEQFRMKNGGNSDLVFALMWHVERYKYEIIPLYDGNVRQEYLFATSFFPYVKKHKDGDSIYQRLSSLSEEDQATWYERYGKYADVPLTDCEKRTICYPTHVAVASFLRSEVSRVISENKDLWDLVEPIPTLQETMAQFAAYVNAPRARRP